MAEERVRRRLAAILAADVVGYTKMIEKDELATRARFNDHLNSVITPAIEEYHGRLVKTMGDGLLIEFGSVVDAVQCGADIQTATFKHNLVEPEQLQWQLRIGIHLGDVIVEDDDIHGEGVNIASRLERIAKPGEVTISDMVYTGVRNKLALNFKDLGQQSLKNIADPLQVYSVTLEQTSADSTGNRVFNRPAVAVLPFKNMSGDPDQDYFSDGLTEKIIIALSLFRSFPVIAGNSTFAYKGRSPDIRTVGEQLGARYVVEGTVRKAGSRVRVTCQLINAETGHHVWADRYDRELEDIFTLQDEVSQRIAAIIEPTLERTEERKTFSKPPSNLAAWEYCMRGNAHVGEWTKEAQYKAREMFSRAIELDPQFARAYSGLATTYSRELRFFGVENRGDCQKRLVEAAQQAVYLDESDSQARLVLSLAYAMTAQPLAAIAEARRAVELNPLDARANNVLGTAYSLSAARFNEGIPYFEKALKLNPIDPNKQMYLTQLALAHLCAGQYDKAVENAQDAIRHRHDLIESHLVLASALGYLQRHDEAQSAIAGYGGEAESYLENHVLFAREVKDMVLGGIRKAKLLG